MREEKAKTGTWILPEGAKEQRARSGWLANNSQFSFFNFPFSIAFVFAIASGFDSRRLRSRREAIENGKLKNEN
jgi:hypothetical protein